MSKIFALSLTFLLATSVFASSWDDVVYFEYTPLVNIDKNGKEVHVPQETLEKFEYALEQVMGDLMDTCLDEYGWFRDSRNQQFMKKIVVLPTDDAHYQRKVSKDNFTTAIKNVLLFGPRTLGKAYAGAVSAADQKITGYNTLEGASKTLFNSDSYKNEYEVDLSVSGQHWMNVYKVNGEYIARSYVLDTPESIEIYLSEYLKKGAGCGDQHMVGGESAE